MSASIEVWRPSGVERTALAGQRVTIGADPSSELCIADDDAVSALHAVLEDYGSGWTVRDLWSRNGTYVNGNYSGLRREVFVPVGTLSYQAAVG
jgi:pSer/pThr/pTyr-binding forkhead associated (FHA) protein